VDILYDMLTSKCVYWAKTGVGDDRRPTYTTPVEIQCRWERKSKMMSQAAGRTVMASHVVYVDRDLVEGGLLKEGPMSLLSAAQKTAPLDNNTGAFEIIRFEKVPTLDGDEFLRTAYL
jgi:hypothetical protein